MIGLIDSITKRLTGWLGTAQAAWVYLASLIAGEGNESSYFESFIRTRRQLIATTLANATSAQNIGAGGNTPIILGGIYIGTALVGTLTISGFTNPSGTATTLVLPALTTAGQALLPADLQMDAGCQMTCSTGADGPNILVAWRNQ